MYLADLHIHSHYSRATSRDLDLPHLDLWARKKGIQLVGTGDFTHPAWREELKEKLIPAEEGFYRLKEEYRIPGEEIPGETAPRFVVSGEISSIYKKNGKVRKVHSVILLPGLEDGERLARKLETIGNIHSDGRPILGLDCHDLLEITLELCTDAIYIPAHIWTPHFSLFGAFSGFDTIEECFEDLTPQIHALETGLSSDPPMNWRVSALDRFQLVSNSDAHSPSKLGREANLLDGEFSYQGLSRAIQTGEGLCGTIEFFPEEGKYHFDGHRKCSICLNPVDAEKYQGICPVCGKKLTIGVSHRVEQLSDRREGFQKAQAKPFESLMPLPEVLASALGASAVSAKVQREYQKLLSKLGPEFEILRNLPIEEIRRTSGNLIAEGIRRLRNGEVTKVPGFDGEYGIIRLFDAAEREEVDGQMSFFDLLGGLGESVAAMEKDGGDQEKLRVGKHVAAGEDAEEKREAQEIASEESQNRLLGEVEYRGGCKESQNGEGESGSESRVQESRSQEQELAIQREWKESHSGEDELGSQSPFSGTFLQKLNIRQAEAVQASDRAIAVTAGPGSGKTSTLIFHIVYLIEHRKVRPSEITAVTFTNQAEAEMKERLHSYFGKGKSLKNLQIGTFHSICSRLLKEAGFEVTLVDETETYGIAKDLRKLYHLSEKPKDILLAISLWKNGVQTEKGKWEPVCKSYQERLEADGVMDFDDLLVKVLEDQDLLDQFRKRFSYLCVDEFQDISPLQQKLIKAWNEGGRELFVIGDADQSIYSFRGSDAHCFEKLKKDDPKLREIVLGENYRSQEGILKLAEAVISENPGQRSKLIAHHETEFPVRLVKAKSELAEGIFIAKEINRLAGGIGMLEAEEVFIQAQGKKSRSFNEIAILYRTHHQARILETCLKKEGIPYVVAGREEFLSEDKVRGTIAFFRSLVSENDTDKKQCLSLLWDLKENEVSEAVYDTMADQFRPLMKKKKPAELLETWMKEMKLEENKELQKFKEMTIFYRHMEEFLEALKLGVESDLRRCGHKTYRGDAVTLMTLHGSKGLEFPVTILFGVKKGMIPFESETHPSDKEEERRLFYVGLTRAKEELILTTSEEPSEFLEHLPKDLMVQEKADQRRQTDGGRQLSLFELGLH